MNPPRRRKSTFLIGLVAVLALALVGIASGKAQGPVFIDGVTVSGSMVTADVSWVGFKKQATIEAELRCDNGYDVTDAFAHAGQANSTTFVYDGVVGPTACALTVFSMSAGTLSAPYATLGGIAVS